MARVRLADLNGPKWTSSNQNRPLHTKMDHFGLANAKIQFGIRSFCLSTEESFDGEVAVAPRATLAKHASHRNRMLLLHLRV